VKWIARLAAALAIVLAAIVRDWGGVALNAAIWAAYEAIQPTPRRHRGN